MPTRTRARAVVLMIAATGVCLALGLGGLTPVLGTEAGANGTGTRASGTGAGIRGTDGGKSSGPSTTTAATASALAAAVARNREAGVAEARRLLGLAPLPPGAVRAASGPPTLNGPVMGTPGVSSVVVQTQFWRAPVSLHQAGAWLASHAPKGLKSVGSSTEGSPGGSEITVGYGYTAPSTAQLQSAELDIGAASLGPFSSALRVDAVVVWTDPRPWPDGQPGRRVHVTVAGGCLATVTGLVGVSNPGADLRARLLPPGPPTAGLACRYYGSVGLSGALPVSQWQKLAHKARLGATGAGRLARTVSAAPISRTVVPAGGFHRTAYNCPMDDGAVALLVFSYPGQPDVDLWDGLSGCTLVGNGYILGAGWDIAPLVKTYG